MTLSIINLTEVVTIKTSRWVEGKLFLNSQPPSSKTSKQLPENEYQREEKQTKENPYHD